MTTLTTEYRTRLRALNEARAALAAHDAEFDTYVTPAREALVRSADRAFYDMEDLRAALRPGYVHRGAYVGWSAATGARPPFHRHAEPVRRLREAIRDGQSPLPRRPLDGWDIAAIERMEAA